MFDEIALLASQIGVAAAFGVAGALFMRQSFNLRWFLAALVLYGLYDFLLTRAFFQIPNLPEGSSWNWLGKLMSIGGMLLVAAIPVFGLRRAGATLRQRKGSPVALLALALFTGFYCAFALLANDGPADAETILYQWTMPGLDEELFYRGILLVALNEAFRARIGILGAPIGYGGLLTSVLFGLAHALSYSEGSYGFAPMVFLATGVPSLLLLWMRERTGSLIFPILAHNMANGVPTLF